MLGGTAAVNHHDEGTIVSNELSGLDQQAKYDGADRKLVKQSDHDADTVDEPDENGDDIVMDKESIGGDDNDNDDDDDDDENNNNK